MLKFFETLTDSRQAWKVKHPLYEVVVLTICAVVAECEAWYQIFHYCRTKEAWFRERIGLELKNGIPSHDTFERVFGLIYPKELEKSFAYWIDSAKAGLEKDEVISIDGKTVCGSADDNKKAVHMVSAWANRNRIVLGQVKTEEKSNEITAIPELLDMIDVSGSTVTIDAMGCQKKISEKITAKGADYVFGLKDNQSELREAAEDYFRAAIKDPALELEYMKKETLEKGHGRIEHRAYYLSNDIDWLDRKGWFHLNGIGMVASCVEEKGQKRYEKRYYLTSLRDIDTFSSAVRQHWGIENSLHWVLDVAFNEDNCRTRKNYSGENFAVIRRIALNLLKQDNTPEMSMRMKRHRCAYDDDFLYNILFNTPLSRTS